jgi:hypothetical protein
MILAQRRYGGRGAASDELSRQKQLIGFTGHSAYQAARIRSGTVRATPVDQAGEPGGSSGHPAAPAAECRPVVERLTGGLKDGLDLDCWSRGGIAGDHVHAASELRRRSRILPTELFECPVDGEGWRPAGIGRLGISDPRVPTAH